MEIKPLGLWRRFFAVFTPTFLLRLQQNKTNDASWGFWFLSNFFLLLIPAIIAGIGGTILLAGFPNNALDAIPADITFELPNGEQYNVKTLVQNAELTIDENFELQTTNIPDPMILAVNEETEVVTFVNTIDEIDVSDTDIVVAIDTKERLVTLEDSEKFPNAILLLHDKFIAKDANKSKTEILTFQDFFSKVDKETKESIFPFTLNLDAIAGAKGAINDIFFAILAVAFGLFYLVLAGFRLVSALFWALIFWAVGSIAKVKNWNFEKSFMAMLHFSFITLLLFPLSLIIGLSLFWSTLIILGLLFGMNFYEMKRMG